MTKLSRKILRASPQLFSSIVISILLLSVFIPVYQVKAEPGLWWDGAWSYRKKITIDHTKVAGDLSNFPVLVSITDSDLTSKAQSDGDDISFTDEYTNKLDHEIEFYNSTSGTLIAWVKLPTVSSVNDTALYMYYGNSAASNQQNIPGTWDTNYVLVQHLKEASGTFYDSSSYRNNGTAKNGATQGIAGKVDGACQLDGTNDYIEVADANSLDGMGALTIEVWLKQSTYHANGIVNKNSNGGYMLQGWSDQQMYFAVSDTTNRAVAPAGSYPLNAWYHLVAVSTGTQLLIYVNSVQKASSSKTTTVPIDSTPLQIGWAGAASAYYFNGLIDEVRISKVARSSAWLTTEYNNQNSPSTFYSVGTEENPPTGITISSETPQDGSQNVQLNPTLRVHFANYYGLMNITLSTNASGTWQTISSYQNVGTGFYSANPTNMGEYKTVYCWKAEAVDDEHSASASKTFSFKTELPLVFDPFNEGWQYRKTITVDHSRVAGDLNNFPMLLDITDSGLAAHAQADGDDIIFTSITGEAARLCHEVESYSSGTGRLIAWINMPYLSSTTDTVLYMYYGNPTATSQENVTGVWDSNYVLVMHLSESSGTAFDSSSYGNNGTTVDGVNQGVAGKIDSAANFDGINDHINITDSSSLEGMSALSIQMWVKHTTQHANGIVSKGGAAATYLVQTWSSPYEGIYLAVNGLGDRAVAPPPPLNEWYYVCGVSTGSQLLIYVNGSHAATSSKATSVPVDDTAVQIGQNGVGAFYNGLVDEVRISKTARTATWIATEYNNQNSPSTFYAVGSEETPPTQILVSNETPQDGSTNAQLNPLLRAYFINYQGLMNITFSTNASGTWQTIGSHQSVVTGYYSVTPTNMNNYETQYWWRVYAEDLEHAKSSTETYSFITKPWNVAPSISDPSPAHNAIDVSQGITHLSFDLSDIESDPMNYTVTTSPDIGSGGGTNVAGDRYSVAVSGVRYSTTYTWTINVTDSKDFTLATYVFTTEPFPTGAQFIGDYACMGLGYIGSATDKNVIYGVWQGPIDVSASGVAVWFAKFDKTLGWVTTNQSVFNPPWGERHPFYGYWDGKYHVCWYDGTVSRIAMADSTTFEGFQSMNGSDIQYFLPGTIPGNSVPSAYAFSDDYVWVFGSDTSTGDEAIAYWVWNSSTGWSNKSIITETANATHGTNFPALLPVSEDAWYLYYTAYGSSGPQLFYVKSTDQGQTWSSEHQSNIASDVSQNSRPSFATYGNNYYIFLIDTAGDVIVYNSTDGTTWGNKQTLYSTATYQVAQGYALDQKTLIWLASDTYQPRTSSQGHYAVGDEIGGVYAIPEMLANPSKPTLSYPANNTVLASGATAIDLKVAVHGSQSYDVAFYWANGTFIGEAKLLTDGDIATLRVTGLSDGQSYAWYAVARGATYGYWGGQPATTTDESRSDTFAFSVHVREAPYVYSENPVNSAVNVPLSTAQLTFTIADPQSDLMNFTVTTTPDIGSSTAIGVGNGIYTVTISDLKGSRVYTWRVSVTDGTNWTNMTYTFSTVLISTFNPFEEGWRYRKAITIDHTKVAGGLTNFPVLIDLTDSDLAAHAQADGDDILFTAATGVAAKLGHEMEYYGGGGGGGRLIVWVNVPSLSSTTNTVLYMYYGNPYAIDQENSTATWDSDYVLIEHLFETSGTIYDSSRYTNDGNPMGGLTQGAIGKINACVQSDGVNDYIEVPDDDSLEGMSALTMELWLKQSTYHNNGIINKAGGTTYLLQGWSDSAMYFQVNGGADRAVAPAGSYPLDQWYHVVAVSTGTQLLIYVNSIVKGSSSKSTTVPTDTTPVQVGQNSAGGYFAGFADEVRISKTARTAEWITTEYNNQNSPSAFYTIGAQEEGTMMQVNPSHTNVMAGEDCVVQIEIAQVTGLYGWEFQLNYNQTILNVTAASIVLGGLNEPTNTYYSLIDQTNGHLWWSVTSIFPATGISYYEHAIFEIHFRGIGVGTSNLGLYGTLLSRNDSSPITHLVVNGSIAVSSGAFDIETTNIVIIDNGCNVYANDTYATGVPYYYPVTVTVHNAGTQSVGSFYVKLEIYWINGSLVEATQEIPVSGLSAGESKIVNFTSLFRPIHKGLYRLTATADSRNDVVEGNEGNNVMILSNTPVVAMGDINGNGLVNIFDAVVVAQAYSSTPTDGHWNIKADLNHDGTINILDGTILSLHWGETT
jgi:hypothetical protein